MLRAPENMLRNALKNWWKPAKSNVCQKSHILIWMLRISSEFGRKKPPVYKQACFWSLVIFTIAACTASAQDTIEKSKKWRFSPLPVVYYSPETRLGFGILLGANFNLGDDAL